MIHTCLGSPTSSFLTEECGPGEAGWRTGLCGWCSRARWQQKYGLLSFQCLCHHPEPPKLELDRRPGPRCLFMGLRFRLLNLFPMKAPGIPPLNSHSFGFTCPFDEAFPCVNVSPWFIHTMERCSEIKTNYNRDTQHGRISRSGG